MAAIDDMTLVGMELTEDERSALSPPGNLTVSQWAERYQVLPSNSPVGTRWLNENSPDLQALQDLAVEPWLRELYLQKAVQRGGSQIFQNIIGCQADQNPQLPALIVLPTEKDVKKNFRKRWLSMFRQAEPLKRLKTRRAHDENSFGIRLSNGYEADVGWAGSASSLASDPKAIILLDEVDKFDHATSKEAEPVDLARRRADKFEEIYKLFALSTCTVEDGQICKLRKTAPIQLRWFVPCPHCHKPQVLHQDQLKWEKYDGSPELQAALIKRNGAAWFECVHCGEKILEQHKRQIMPLGFWCTDDAEWRVYPDGRREGVRPPGDRVGVILTCFGDYQKKWATLAGRMVQAGKDPEKLRDIYNNDFAEPFQMRVSGVGANKFAKMCQPDPLADPPFVPAKAGLVPAWASRLLLTIDTQKTGFYWVVRAWGFGRRSQRVSHGYAHTFDELDSIERSPWFYANGPDGHTFPPLTIFRTGIDTGGTAEEGTEDASRTEQVYRWCLQKPVLRVPLKGSSKPIPSGVRWAPVTYTPRGGERSPFEVTLHLFDTQFYAGLLMAAWDGQVPDGEGGSVAEWSLNDRQDAEYDRHLSNLHVARVKYRGVMVNRIVPKGLGVRVDYFDCEKEQFALAVGMNLCTALETPEQLAGRLAMVHQPPPEPRGIRRPDGQGFFARRPR